MKRRTQLKELHNYIEENKFLVVGSPQGVGFTSYMVEYIAYKMFFEESFYAMILTGNRRDKLDISFDFKKAFEQYKYPISHEIIDNIHFMHIKGGDGCGVSIINYDEIDLDMVISAYNNYDGEDSSNEAEIDLMVIDKDDFSNYLYKNIIKLTNVSKKIVFNTYDLPHSLIYDYGNIDMKRIVLDSKYSEENINKNYGSSPNKINYDRILLGDFNL